jgi:hypothetical protein
MSNVQVVEKLRIGAKNNEMIRAYKNRRQAQRLFGHWTFLVGYWTFILFVYLNRATKASISPRRNQSVPAQQTNTTKAR